VVNVSIVQMFAEVSACFFFFPFVIRFWTSHEPDSVKTNIILMTLL